LIVKFTKAALLAVANERRCWILSNPIPFSRGSGFDLHSDIHGITQSLRSLQVNYESALPPFILFVDSYLFDDLKIYNVCSWESCGH